MKEVKCDTGVEAGDSGGGVCWRGGLLEEVVEGEVQVVVGDRALLVGGERGGDGRCEVGSGYDER